MPGRNASWPISERVRMSSQQTQRKYAHHVWHEALGGALGALSGAGMGALAAGPPGALAGAVIGAGMGASTAWAAGANAAEVAAREAALDAEIGVSGGSLGIAGLKHPPAKIGAYSSEAVGNGSATEDGTLAEGPILPPPSA